MQLRCTGYQQITDLSSVVSLTLPTGQANFLRLEVEGEDVRWRADGTDPTNSIGGVLKAGGQYEYQGNLSLVRMIESVAGAEVNVTYYYATAAGA